MSNYSIFSVVGIEIEYMLVDQQNLNVQPKSDVLLENIAGSLVNEVSLGDIELSNELVMHVIELKNNGPKPPTTDIASQFQKAITQLQPLLQNNHLQLLPSGAHPWMDPLQETKRWPHGNKAIYQQYDSIFNCQGHGWANLQSMHVNLPFANDEEFCQLHSVVRLILPLLPALAASTPILEGRKTDFLDARLDFYGKNQKRVPSISANVIPEFIRTEQQYEDEILKPMYKDISVFDKEGILQYEWLNSRAAIPKFNCKALEIRIIDSQECVNADIAIAKAICAILKSWHEASCYHLDNACSTERLKSVYDQTIRQGLSVLVEDKEILTQWQLPKRSLTVLDAWSLLIERVSSDLDHNSQRALENILRHGNLSERILNACQHDYSRSTLTRIYRQLGDCLLHNQQFVSI